MRIVLAVFLVGSLGCAQAVPLDDVSQASCKGGQSTTHDSSPATVDSATDDSDGAIDDSAIEDTGSIEDTRVDPPDASGDPCTDCMTTSCSTEISACFSDSECSALMDCLGTCADDACASACMSAHPSPAYDAFVSCVTSSCSAPCGGP